MNKTNLAAGTAHTLRMLVLLYGGLMMIPAQAAPQDLLRMSEQLDRVDKGDFDEALSKVAQCTRARDYTCAEAQLKNARRFSSDTKSKSALKRAEDDLFAERARENEEHRRAAQRQRELERQEAQLRQSEQRARDAERQAQAEADERENLNSRIAAAGNAYSQTIRAQANARVAEQARGRQFEQQQAEAARNVASDQRRLAQERAQLETQQQQRQQQQRQLETQRLQLAQAQQQDTQRARTTPVETRSTPSSQPVRDVVATATPPEIPIKSSAPAQPLSAGTGSNSNALGGNVPSSSRTGASSTERQAESNSVGADIREPNPYFGHGRLDNRVWMGPWFNRQAASSRLEACQISERLREEQIILDGQGSRPSRVEQRTECVCSYSANSKAWFCNTWYLPVGSAASVPGMK